MTDGPVTLVGATSKLGQNLMRRLAGRGRKVIPLGRRLDALTPEQRTDARHFDLEQPGSLQTALQGAEYVVSCVHAYDGAAVVAALPATVKRVVLLGSTRIFSRYSNRNIEKQKDAVAALANSGIPGVVLHPTMIYGGPADANVQRIAAYIRKFGAVPLPAGGTALLQPIHTDDVVSCIEAALQRDEAPGEPVIVAGPQVISYRDLVQAVGRAIGTSPTVLPVPGFALQIAAALTAAVPGIPTIRIDEVRRLGEDKTFPIDEMRRRLGVEPIDISTGLARTFSR
ncbi:NADH-ubiquinone oxidoreductase [Ferrovibrio terrae]|uniref:NADH-ubiquinone oxidoreductase n=1 Tax=Ferrovibrio terrae TaxID=2594003 RepID=A0A516H4W7_9PROT|nr:NAD(P)H-binding protein [Ferrovibrio terrae]QDO98805.1 NADH-ubiquinone oxidoreductase [Ferrovibrio terrae]